MTTLLDQVDVVSARLASIQKRHRFNEPTVLKIAELVFNNYWTGRQLEIQAAQAGLVVTSDETEVTTSPPPDDIDIDENIEGETTEEDAA